MNNNTITPILGLCDNIHIKVIYKEDLNGTINQHKNITHNSESK